MMEPDSLMIMNPYSTEILWKEYKVMHSGDRSYAEDMKSKRARWGENYTTPEQPRGPSEASGVPHICLAKNQLAECQPDCGL